jgi:malate dehydrogenase (oxaloacetate-decarboxylating)(NADP+)
MSTVPPAVARAAMETGVARRPIVDMAGYAETLRSRLDPIAGTLARIFEKVRRKPRRVAFAEGEEEQVIRAASAFVNQGLGSAILVGREDRVRATAEAAGVDLRDGISIDNARLSGRTSAYTAHLYGRLQRQGFLQRDCQRLVNQDRNHFAACMVALGDADAMISGVTRNYATVLEDVGRVIDHKPGHRLMGVTIAIARGRTVVIADTALAEIPGPDALADIAVEAANVARRLGYEPRVALLASSSFGNPPSERSERVREAVGILERRHVDFEFDGEMAADVALSRDAQATFPFTRLSGPANVLVMPALHSASIATKMLQTLGGATVIGPLLVGFDKPVQIVGLGATDSDLVNMAALAAFNIGG